MPPIFSWVKNIFRNLPPFFSWVKNIFRNLPPFFSWVGPTWAHPLGPHVGPPTWAQAWAQTPPPPAPAPAPPDEFSDPNLTPLPTHPGIKYVARTLAATIFHIYAPFAFRMSLGCPGCCSPWLSLGFMQQVCPKWVGPSGWAQVGGPTWGPRGAQVGGPTWGPSGWAHVGPKVGGPTWGPRGWAHVGPKVGGPMWGPSGPKPEIWDPKK